MSHDFGRRPFLDAQSMARSPHSFRDSNKPSLNYHPDSFRGQESTIQYRRTCPRKVKRMEAGPTLIPAASSEGWVLFATNLHEETGEDDLRTAFGEHGEVMRISLNLDRRTGFVKGYALIEYKTYVEALRARAHLNESDLLGSCVRVDWCHMQVHSHV